jgi:hypothetical protein
MGFLDVARTSGETIRDESMTAESIAQHKRTAQKGSQDILLTWGAPIRRTVAVAGRVIRLAVYATQPMPVN